MCGCNNKQSNATSYVVTKKNGQTEEYGSKVQADIAATKHGGTITVKKK